ncbi:MAG: hypothetical protein ABI778_12390, partial [Ignavibacteriota bacterium]
MKTTKSEVRNQNGEWVVRGGRGKITLCIGAETGSNITASLVSAASLARDPRTGPVLYLNTIQTPRKLGMSIRSTTNMPYSEGKQNPRLSFYCVEPGLFSGECAAIERRIEEMKATTIIINSLDFASKDYRRREELIFTVMDWLARYDLNIIIFSEMRKSLPKPGKIQYGGGVGKLAGIAESVETVGENYELGITNYESETEDVIPANVEDSPRRAGMQKGGDAWIPASAGMTIGGAGTAPVMLANVEDSPRRAGMAMVEAESNGSEREENLLDGLRIGSTGIVNESLSAKPKHYPMSNKNRALVAQYEKLHGKSQLPGESFRDMFDRIVAIAAASEIGAGKVRLREMLTV